MLVPRAALLAAFGLAAIACEGGGAGVTDGGPACDAGACAPYACAPSGGTCLHACRDERHCAAGSTCQDGRCVGTECTPATAPAACGVYPCVEGVCAHDCALGPCAEGYHCRADGVCEPHCTRRSDPLCGGRVCDVEVGECEPYCLDGELPCAAGYACAAGGVCEPDPLAPPCAGGCGAFACVTALDRCATRCLDDHDCVAPAVCRGDRCE